jgi:hypothetical protein
MNCSNCSHCVVCSRCNDDEIDELDTKLRLAESKYVAVVLNENKEIAALQARIKLLEAVRQAAQEWATECRDDIGHDKLNLTWLCQALKDCEAGGA